MNSPSNFTALSVSLSRTAPNLAPAKPIQDAIEKKSLKDKSPSKFEEAVRKIYEERLNYQKVSWDEAISAGQLAALFLNGDMLLQRRQWGPGYYVRPIVNDDTYRQTAMPGMFRFYYQCIETKFTSANPTVTMRPGGDDPLDIAAAQAARPWVDYWESQFYTSKFSRRECMYAATNGIFIHRVRWNPFKGEWMAQSREVGEQSIQLDEGIAECVECQYQGSASEFPQTQFGDQCPECGSAAVDVQRREPQSLPQISLGASKPIGEPEIIQTPFAGWRWDLSKDLEDSPWAIYRQRISSGAISLMLGDLTLPDTSSSDDRGLAVVHALAYGGQAIGGSTMAGERRDNDTRPTLAEFWMSDEDYADIDIEEGETVCGLRLPAGKMRNSFKGPICVVGLNDMSLIVGTYANETHKDEVVTGHWFMKSDSGAGRGLQDAVAVQKRFNAVDGQIYQGLAATATPAVMTDLRLLKEDQSGYLFKPNTTLDINLSMLPPGMRMQDAVYLGTPGNVNQQYIQYGSVFLKDMFQVSSLVTEFSDFMSIDNRTATGAQITSALANSLFGPMLLTKGETRVRIAKILVCIGARYGSVPRFFPGKANARGRSVSGSDLKGKVIFELEQNSELPVTPFSQQTDIRVALESFGGVDGFLALEAAKPAMFHQMLKPFNLKLEAEDSDTISTICLEQLEQMKSNLQMGVSDPQMLVDNLIPPISLYEPKQKEKATWWGDWLDLDTARKAPMVLRIAAEQMIVKYQNLDAQRQIPQTANAGLIQGIGAAAAAAPSALGAAALQQQQPQPEQQDDSMQIQADMAMEESSQKTDLELKRMESETQLAVARQQGQNAIATTKLAGENAVKVARAKPKPKSAGKVAA